jgi:hypothetical protein
MKIGWLVAIESEAIQKVRHALQVSQRADLLLPQDAFFCPYISTL